MMRRMKREIRKNEKMFTFIMLTLTLSLLSINIFFMNAGYAQGELPSRNESIEQFNESFFSGYVAWEGGGASTIPMVVYVGIALMVMVGLVGIAFIIGYAFNIQSLIVWGKVEMINAIATAILIGFIVGLLYTGSSIVSGFLGKGQVICMGHSIDADDTGQVLLCRINEKIIELDKLYEQIYKANRNWEYEGSKCRSFFGFTIGCGDWVPKVRKQIETAHLLTTKITGLEVGLNMEYVAVQYIFQNMLIIFLPLGLILRAFPITRGVGGLMISLAIGLYFIFPMLAVYFDPGYVERPDLEDVFDIDYTQECYGGFFGATAITNYIRDDANIEKTNFNFEQASDIYTNILYGTQFYHYVAFAITIVFIGMMAPIFGGDMGEMTRFIMKVV